MPTEIDYPGVYVQEREGGGRTIEGVSTSVAAFVGYTIEGPLNEPVRVTGSADFERAFGAIDATSDLSYAIAHFFQNGGSDAWVIRVVGAADLARPTPAELIGSQADRTGIYALDAVDLLNLLVIPNQADSELQAAMIDYAKARRAFAILDLPDTVDTLPEARAWITDFDTSKGLNAAAYFPRIVASDPAQSGQRRSFANSGAIAGIYARTDAQRGVWKAPAGTDASISGVEDLDCHLTQNELGTINTLGLNPLCTFPIGTVVWGARTLAGADTMASEWKYVPVRRTALFLEESIYRGLQWAVFEPNAEPLWAEVRLCASAFLQSLYRQGAFQGVTPNQAYLVKCDAETTTQQDIDDGTLNVLIGFAPLKPAEFVVIQIRLFMSA